MFRCHQLLHIGRRRIVRTSRARLPHIEGATLSPPAVLAPPAQWTQHRAAAHRVSLAFMN